MNSIPTLVLLTLLILVSSSAVQAQQDRYVAITIPTRDGKELAADLYANSMTVAKPVILIQTPYNKNLYRLAINIPPQAGGTPFPYDSANYNYVIVDWRGFYGSKDAATGSPLYDRGLDGYDAVEWIASQPWCNGRVGTWGPSALGAIQFMTAEHHPPHLFCAVPLVKDFKTKYEDYYYGGDYRKEHVETLGALGLASPDLILSRPTKDNLWTVTERNSDHPDSFAIPMLLISGWYDHYPDDIIRAFHDLREKSAPAVRANHKLMMGPWLHGAIGKEAQGALVYPNAVGSSDTIALRFFDHYLRNIDNGYPADPAIRYYQMGTDEWRATDDWYALAREADTMAFYLWQQKSLSGSEWPIAEIDMITYDPNNPSPTHGGARIAPLGVDVADGPLDQRDVVESRNDVLIYTTGPLENDIEVNGGVQVHLYLSSDREDTDIGVRLCDVYPAGFSMLMTQGITRMRFRNGVRPQDTAAMIPGRVYPVTVNLQQLALTFRKGHRIRIIISGSNYPKFDINPNTGGPLYQPGPMLVAMNRIHYGGAYPSRVTMPVVAISGVDAVADHNATASLDAAMPNPFSDAATIRFTLPRRTDARLAVYDILGRKVATLIDGTMEAGTHTARWEPVEVPGGMYFYRLETEGRAMQRPIVRR